MFADTLFVAGIVVISIKLQHVGVVLRLLVLWLLSRCFMFHCYQCRGTTEAATIVRRVGGVDVLCSSCGCCVSNGDTTRLCECIDADAVL